MLQFRTGSTPLVKHAGGETQHVFPVTHIRILSSARRFPPQPPPLVGEVGREEGVDISAALLPTSSASARSTHA